MSRVPSTTISGAFAFVNLKENGFYEMGSGVSVEVITQKPDIDHRMATCRSTRGVEVSAKWLVVSDWSHHALHNGLRCLFCESKPVSVRYVGQQQ